MSRHGEGTLGRGTEQGWISAPVTLHPPTPPPAGRPGAAPAVSRGPATWGRVIKALLTPSTGGEEDGQRGEGG